MVYPQKLKLDHTEIPPLYKMQTGIYKTPPLYEGSNTTPKRNVNEYEIEFYTHSTGTTILNGVEYPIKKGMILFSKPGHIRNSILPFVCRFIHLVIPNNKKYAKFMDFLDLIPNIIETNNYDKYLALFDNLFELYSSDLPYKELSVQAKMLDLITSIYYDSTTNDTYSGNENIKMIIEYINKNISKKITLRELADILHFSPNYFHKYFKDNTGMTPHKYILNLRINKAMKLLKLSNSSLTSIADECGFESQAYFCYVFKQTLNMTPKEYKKNHDIDYEL